MNGTFNYGRFSATFIDETYDSKMYFLEHPEDVIVSGYNALSSAFWFYMTP